MFNTMKILLVSFLIIQLNAQELQQGQKYLALTKYSDAKDMFNTAILKDNSNSEAYYYLGKTNKRKTS